MIDKNLDHLHPLFKPKALAFLATWKTTYPQRPSIEITETWRDPAREDELHAQGITKATGATCKHCFMIDGKPASKAFDFLIRDEDGNPIADGTDDWYSDAGDIAVEVGMIWGGDFVHSPPDYDHCELKE